MNLITGLTLLVIVILSYWSSVPIPSQRDLGKMALRFAVVSAALFGSVCFAYWQTGGYFLAVERAQYVGMLMAAWLGGEFLGIVHGVQQEASRKRRDEHLKYHSTDFAELMQALDSTRPETRAAAAEGLGRLRDRRAVDRLLQEMRTDNRESTVNALGRIGDDRAVDPLVDQMRAYWDSGSFSVHQIIAALGQIGSTRALPALIKILVSPSIPMTDYRRVSVATAVGAIYQKSAGTLTADEIQTIESLRNQVVATESHSYQSGKRLVTVSGWERDEGWTTRQVAEDDYETVNVPATLDHYLRKVH